MPRWFDNAVEDLERNLEDGLISDEEFHREMRELQLEYREEAHEAADRARQDYYES